MGTGPAAEEEEITQAAMKKGSVLIYLGSLIHGGGANVTERPRAGLVISYSCGWLRQAENQYLAVPAGIARRSSREAAKIARLFRAQAQSRLGRGAGSRSALLDPEKYQADEIFTEFLPDEVKPLLQEYRAKEKKAA